MPRFAPITKVVNCRRLGANVLLHGDNIAEARSRADELVAEKGFTYVNGYDDAAIIAGQGTLGLEVAAQGPGRRQKERNKKDASNRGGAGGRRRSRQG